MIQLHFFYFRMPFLIAGGYLSHGFIIHKKKIWTGLYLLMKHMFMYQNKMLIKFNVIVY